MTQGVFRAVADPHRRLILDRLRDHGELTLGELCEGMPMTRQAVSKHVARLKRSGLLEVRPRGRERLHRLRAEPLTEVVGWLAEYANLWDSRLEALRTYLEEHQ